MTPKPDERLEEKIVDVCTLYAAAPQLAAAGERVMSTDEMTGVQALERAAPGLPLAPAKVERREFEYIRHGTQTFTINLDVVTGQVLVPSCGPTRTEADFLEHVKGTVATDPLAPKWHFVTDNLNIHISESLVRYVAADAGITDDLGIVRGVIDDDSKARLHFGDQMVLRCCILINICIFGIMTERNYKRPRRGE